MNPSSTPQNFTELKQFFSNHMSLSFETDGFSPLVGRIFSQLLFAPEPLSLQEMADQLNVTKAAISVQVRTLEKHCMCHKLPTANDRRDYYHIADDFSATVIRTTVHKMKAIQLHILHMLDLFKRIPPAGQEEQAAYDAAKLRFLEMKALYELILSRMEGLEEEWGRKREQLMRDVGSETSEEKF
ncbi:MarR family transcriptional regulator [Paenibacillus filicis]|uniref:MarR family transcriptional regulator n=1 Tax=Paenibacillus gyeongsangnamensis TaxID=3388067 RepID=A0ABT4Q332_9BACL|nr:MarR family transcriptional regulator [Paenibacillus filicis]MCZ8511294.1 MarR family transcriptional regulator [Paenibacillus filicis]